MEMRGYKHGYFNTKVYQAWEDAKSRCSKESHPEYKRYGGKGIYMCAEWFNDPKAWCEYLGSPPDTEQRWSVDRVDCSKGYSPGNIRWELPDKQARNKKMAETNTSGVTGVSWRCEGTWIVVCARWKTLDGKHNMKSFSVKKYGLLPAFLLACNYRDKMIAELNEQGAGYSESHGK